MEDRYIQMRNSGNYDIVWFYEYYIQNSKDTIDINNFKAIFMLGDINNILEHIDRKFGLTRIYDKNNNLVKVYK